MDDRERIRQIDAILAGRYAERPALEFSSPFTLLVAAILAAQCTDERVNRVTRELFLRFPSPRALAEAPVEELEQAIHSTGFFRQKARTLQACCLALVERFGGEVPSDPAELTKIPGIGRKTANLVLGNSLGQSWVFVDTHVRRVAFRLGFTRQSDPDRIEADLTALLPEERRTAFSNLLTHLGRDVCVARKPRCSECPIRDLCPKMGVN